MADLSNLRILAADDHPLIRAGLVSYLETEPGLKVVAEAGNGEEALEKYRELRPDIVLMDVSMPVMDGLAATRAILDEFPDAKVIVLTTYGGDEDIYQALDAGAVGYLVKDMASAEVLNIIRTGASRAARHPPTHRREARRAHAAHPADPPRGRGALAGRERA
jgi:two-component system, NarL family, response regulator